MIVLPYSLTHKPKRDGVIKWGMTLATATILAGVVICLYWLALDRRIPIEVKKGEVVLYQQQQDYSWVFIVRWTGTLKRRCGGISKRWIVDGFRLPLVDVPYPAEAEPNRIGEDFSWEVPIHVPAYFVSTGHTSGLYRAIFFYACNPMQERIFPIVQEAPTVRFELPLDNPPMAPHPPSTSSLPGHAP